MADRAGMQRGEKMENQEHNYDRDYRIAKLIAMAHFGSSAVLIAVAELLRRGAFAAPLSPLFEGSTLSLIRIIFYALAAAIILAAVLLKLAIRNPEDSLFSRPLKFLIRQARSHRNTSAVAMLIPPSAMGEACVVLGFVLFILSGGLRPDLYIFGSSGLAAMILLFPTEEEKRNLVRLDREQE